MHQLIVALQPKQQQLLDAILDRRVDAPTVLGYGGSRGAAKSGAVRRIALYLAFETACTIWIIRRVWDDLNKDHVLEMWREYPDLKQYYSATEHKITLPNGSVIFFIHSGDSGRAKRKARGPQAQYIFLEQAEEFSQEEMEQLAGSNRAPGVAPGTCKRIYTFNPGGIGTNYLRRIFHLRQFHDNEAAGDFLFIQAYGWDNYEWFRGLGTVSEWDFYNSPEWSAVAKFEYFNCEVSTSRRAFEAFITQTDFGRKLAGLPQSQRIGELMGSFEKFAGQYYAEVWEESAIVLPCDLVAKIVQPWWKRWLATDWGFSHYAATGWFTAGLLSPAEVLKYFGVQSNSPVRVIIMLREAVCSDVPEPDLAKLIVSMTPEGERREVRAHYIGHDAYAKRGSANTVVEQMEPELTRGGLQRLQRADIDRVGGWRLLYNCWASARRLRTWPEGQAYAQHPEDQPCLFISAGCTEVIQAVPMLICDQDDPTDIRKIPGAVEDDVADMCFVGTTPVAAEGGSIPIAEVKPGDRVWTRDGLAVVEHAWKVGRKPIVKAVFSNGAETLCTQDHQFFTLNRGFARLDSLRYGDKLVTWNQSYTMEENTPSFQLDTSGQESDSCTGISGRRRMGQFLQSITSTIATATQRTTQSKTWNASRQRRITNSTPIEDANPQSICQSSERQRPNGTAQTPGGNGTASTLGRELFPKNPWFASIAARISNRSKLWQNSARTPARRNPGALLALIWSWAFAKSAAKNSHSTATTNPQPAAFSVVRLCGFEAAGFADVFDIEVRESHEFFAGGILVHNCRYGIKSHLSARGDAPHDVQAAETYQKYQDPTARAMAMLRLSVEQSKSQNLARKRRR